MLKIIKHIEIDAPVETVFEYLSHPENLTQIWPSMMAVENVEETETGGMTYDWTYKMAGLPFKGKSTTRERVDNKRVVVTNEGSIPSKFVWNYEPCGEKGMALDLEVEYEIPSKLLGRFAEPILRRINDNEADIMLRNLKIVMEG